jgi:catechol 2,3-dioxygenase-like lactoylglutathione lyase family enzyme
VDITGIDHVAINVANLERSAEWYARVLGFEVFHKWKRTWMISRGPMRIGLFHRPDATAVDDLDNRRAITHFAFVTDSNGFERAQDELRKLDIPFDPPEDTGIAYSLFVSDPDGFSVEITTYHALTERSMTQPQTKTPTDRDVSTSAP